MTHEGSSLFSYEGDGCYGESSIRVQLRIPNTSDGGKQRRIEHIVREMRSSNNGTGKNSQYMGLGQAQLSIANRQTLELG